MSPRPPILVLWAPTAPKYWHVIVSRLLLVGPPRRETVDLFVSCDTHNPVSHDASPFNHSDTSSLYLIPIYSRLRRHPDRGWLCSLTRDQQYRREPCTRGSPLTLAGHQPLGPDADPSTNEGRGTPRDTTEGLDQDTCWSDHSDPFHTTLGMPVSWRSGAEPS